jgi:hypothetical protein
VIVVDVLIGLAVGLFLGAWGAGRWIDHRWYCGHWHRASHPCQPAPAKLAEWRQLEERRARAEVLEGEARRLRGSWPT